MSIVETKRGSREDHTSEARTTCFILLLRPGFDEMTALGILGATSVQYSHFV